MLATMPLDARAKLLLSEPCILRMLAFLFRHSAKTGDTWGFGVFSSPSVSVDSSPSLPLDFEPPLALGSEMLRAAAEELEAVPSSLLSSEHDECAGVNDAIAA